MLAWLAVAALAQDKQDSGAYTWMITAGGASGAHVGAGLVAAAKGTWDADAFWGGVLGAGLGTATVGALKPEDGYTAADTVLLTTGSGVGAWAGTQLGRTLIAPGAEGEVRRLALAGVLGNVAGTGVALAATKQPPDAAVLARADLAALIGWQAAAGAMDLAALDVTEDRQLRAPISLAAGLGAGATGLALSGLQAPPPDVDLIGISMAHGAWVGAWAPLLFVDSPDEQQVFGGLRLGLGAGYLASLALAPVVKPDTRSTSVQVAGLLAGNALGAGIPMALGVDPEDEPRAVVAPMLAGSVAGQVYGAVMSRHYALDADHAAVGSTLALWTAYQAVGWGFYAGHAVGQPQGTGYALVAAGAGTTAGIALTPVLDVDAAGATLAASAGGWATWYGGWIGHLAGLAPEHHWLATLGAGNVGLLGTGAAVAGRDVPWRTVALIDGFGAMGGAGGALLGVVASPDADVIAATSLAGSTVGLGIGAWRAAAAEPATQQASLGSVRGGWQTRLTALPWMGTDGSPGVYVGIDGREVTR